MEGIKEVKKTKQIVELKDIGNGSIIQQIEEALEQAHNDVNNPKRVWSEKRVINIKISFQPTKDDPDIINYDSSVSFKGASIKSWGGVLFNSPDGFSEDSSKQMKLFSEDD